MKVVIDRFEGDYAVVEISPGNFADLPVKLIPPEADEGSVLSITLDREETDIRRKKIDELMKTIWKD